MSLTIQTSTVGTGSSTVYMWYTSTHNYSGLHAIYPLAFKCIGKGTTQLEAWQRCFNQLVIFWGTHSIVDSDFSNAALPTLNTPLNYTVDIQGVHPGVDEVVHDLYVSTTDISDRDIYENFFKTSYGEVAGSEPEPEPEPEPEINISSTISTDYFEADFTLVGNLEPNGYLIFKGTNVNDHTEGTWGIALLNVTRNVFINKTQNMSEYEVSFSLSSSDQSTDIYELWYGDASEENDQVIYVFAKNGYAYATQYNQELIFFRSFNTYNNNTIYPASEIVDINEEHIITEDALDENIVIYAGIETTTYNSFVKPQWYQNRSSLNKVIFLENQIIKPISTSYWFSGWDNLNSNNDMINLENLDTSNVILMLNMFAACENLISLDLSSFNTSKVTNMSNMFHNCHSLTSLNLSRFNTANVTDMSYMFYYCNSLTSLDLSNFNTANVEIMNYMFANCPSLTSLNLSTFNTTKVRAMLYMFVGCSSLISLNISNFSFNSILNNNTVKMLDGCSKLEELKIPINLKNSNNESISIELPELDFREILDNEEKLIKTKTGNWFLVGNDMQKEIEGLTIISPANSELWEELLDYSIDDNDKTIFVFKAQYARDYAIYDPALSSINFFVISTTEDGLYADGASDSNLRQYWYADRGGWRNLSLQTLEDIQTISFNSEIEAPQDISNWFKNMTNLVNIYNFTNFKVNSTEIFNSLFENCESLESLDLSNFNNRIMSSGQNMFTNCSSLNTLKLGNDFLFASNCGLRNDIEWIRSKDLNNNSVTDSELISSDELISYYDPNGSSVNYLSGLFIEAIECFIKYFTEETAGIQRIIFKDSVYKGRNYILPTGNILTIPVETKIIYGQREESIGNQNYELRITGYSKENEVTHEYEPITSINNVEKDYLIKVNLDSDPYPKYPSEPSKLEYIPMETIFEGWKNNLTDEYKNSRDDWILDSLTEEKNEHILYGIFESLKLFLTQKIRDPRDPQNWIILNQIYEKGNGEYKIMSEAETKVKIEINDVDKQLGTLVFSD